MNPRSSINGKRIVNTLFKIRSKYILRDIFHYISQRKFLNIIKYNNELKRSLEINLKDYAEFLQTEIEIIPVEYKSGKIINFENKKESKYIHIFFNDSNQERNISEYFRTFKMDISKKVEK